MNTESKQEFKAGDIVTCAFFKDKHFTLEENNSSNGFCICIKNGNDKFGFLSDGRYMHGTDNSLLTLVSRPKKKESVTWHRVCYQLKGNKKPYFTNNVFESVESYLNYEDRKKEDFYFIHLKPVVTHEYEVES